MQIPIQYEEQRIRTAHSIYPITQFLPVEFVGKVVCFVLNRVVFFLQNKRIVGFLSQYTSTDVLRF